MQITKPTTKPTKQRKALYQMPDHRRHKLFAARLSPNLRTTHGGVKTFPVRSGDTVRIMRGDHEGFEGKITHIDLMKYRVYVEGLTREKVDGTTIFVPVHPSKVMITNLNLDDKWRKEILQRKKKAKLEEAEEKPAKRPPKEVTKVEKKAIEEKAPTEEKPPEKKPKREKKKVAKKKTAKKEKQAEEAPEKVKKSETKKPRAKRKTAQIEGEA